jgi:hypothetical protein
VAEKDSPRASLASASPYPVPEGARLAFRYRLFTTDGFMRGDVLLVLPNGGEEHVIAPNIPVMGTSRQVKAMGDYAKLFPEPIPVQGGENGV